MQHFQQKQKGSGIHSIWSDNFQTTEVDCMKKASFFLLYCSTYSKKEEDKAENIICDSIS